MLVAAMVVLEADVWAGVGVGVRAAVSVVLVKRWINYSLLIETKRSANRRFSW